MSKCTVPGVSLIDPCIYQTEEAYKNVTVIIRKCKYCGHVDIAWVRQEDTEQVEDCSSLD